MLALREDWYFLTAAYVDAGIEPFNMQKVDWCGIIFKKGNEDSNLEWNFNYRVALYKPGGEVKKTWFQATVDISKSKEDLLESFKRIGNRIAGITGKEVSFIDLDGNGMKALSELVVQPWIKFVYRQ